MKLHGTTWVAIVAAVIIFALLNLKCWMPGFGGRTDLVNGERPAGSELELFYGWPACYRAELLRSDDAAVTDRLLKHAPFIRIPVAQMRVAARYDGWLALLLDASF